MVNISKIALNMEDLNYVPVVPEDIEVMVMVHYVLDVIFMVNLIKVIVVNKRLIIIHNTINYDL